MKLHGQLCQCGGCGEYFRSTYAFDQHRQGPYTARFCLKPVEMSEKGWGRLENGAWMTPGKASGSLAYR
jgi:hypothetical protein